MRNKSLSILRKIQKLLELLIPALTACKILTYSILTNFNTLKLQRNSFSHVT